MTKQEMLQEGLELWELQMKSVAARYSLTYTPPANVAPGA